MYAWIIKHQDVISGFVSGVSLMVAADYFARGDMAYGSLSLFVSVANLLLSGKKMGSNGQSNWFETDNQSANFAEIPKKIQPWGFSVVNIYMNNTTESTQLTIADLAGIRNIIDLACQRGAIRGEEMKNVGLLFERLTNFIIDAQEAAEAQAQAPDAEPKPTEPAKKIQGE